jgi:uncharacterized membrane protein
MLDAIQVSVIESLIFGLIIFTRGLVKNHLPAVSLITHNNPLRRPGRFTHAHSLVACTWLHPAANGQDLSGNSLFPSPILFWSCIDPIHILSLFLLGQCSRDCRDNSNFATRAGLLDRNNSLCSRAIGLRSQTGSKIKSPKCCQTLSAANSAYHFHPSLCIPVS